MKEYFIIADPHSYFDEMLNALSDNGFDIKNKEHIIIGCGDYLDRGNRFSRVSRIFI